MRHIRSAIEEHGVSLRPKHVLISPDYRRTLETALEADEEEQGDAPSAAGAPSAAPAAPAAAAPAAAALDAAAVDVTSFAAMAVAAAAASLRVFLPASCAEPHPTKGSLRSPHSQDKL